MGIFDFLKKKEESYSTKNVVACAKGVLTDITKVDDPMFSQKMMGDGFAIEPLEGDVCSPIDGVIKMMFPTGHAFGVVRDDGLEVLVHIGINTVELNGYGFQLLKKQGDKVKAGEICIIADLNVIKNHKYSATIMNIFTTGIDNDLQELNYNSIINMKDIIIEDATIEK